VGHPADRPRQHGGGREPEQGAKSREETEKKKRGRAAAPSSSKTKGEEAQEGKGDEAEQRSEPSKAKRASDTASGGAAEQTPKHGPGERRAKARPKSGPQHTQGGEAVTTCRRRQKSAQRAQNSVALRTGTLFRVLHVLQAKHLPVGNCISKASSAKHELPSARQGPTKVDRRTGRKARRGRHTREHMRRRALGLMTRPRVKPPPPECAQDLPLATAMGEASCAMHSYMVGVPPPT
jgi:hypothetical protein